MNGLNQVLPEKQVGLYTGVLAALERAIMQAELKPGQHLKESELATRYGVSRGPVREALQELERKGVVVKLPNRGTFVAHWSQKEIDDFYLFRIHTEAFSARLAAERRTQEDVKDLTRLVRMMQLCLEDGDTYHFLDVDAEFHWRVALAAKCAPLLATVETLRWQTRLAMAWEKGNHTSPEQFEHAVHFHERITEAVEQADGEAAAQAMREHVQASAARVHHAWSEAV